MDRVNGWAEVLQRLGDPEAACSPSTINYQPSTTPAPRLFIHPRCARLIDTLPALQHDPSHPEDVLKVDADEDGVGGDDAADALRYLVATRPRVIQQRKLRGLRPRPERATTYQPRAERLRERRPGFPAPQTPVP